MSEPKIELSDAELADEILKLENRRKQLLHFMWLRDQVSTLESGALPPRFKSDVNIICDAVCKHFKITMSDVTGDSRVEAIVIPRHIIFYLASEIMDISKNQIAKMFRRDHGTVLSGIKNVLDRKQVDKTYHNMVEKLRETCQEQANANVIADIQS